MKRYYLLISLLLASTIGFAQEPKNSDSSNSLNLYLPKLDNEDIATTQDYKNCIDLTQDKYLVIINGQKHNQPDILSLSSFIKSKSRSISNKALNIIVGAQTSNEKLVNVLDILVDQNIDRYKILFEKKKAVPTK